MKQNVIKLMLFVLFFTQLSCEKQKLFSGAKEQKSSFGILSVPTMDDINNNLAFVKMDKINTSLGSAFGMHFISTVWVGSTLYTYYISHPAANPSLFTVGLATSTDGVSFTNLGEVLPVGPAGSWDDRIASFPGIWYDGGVFYMVYEGAGTGSTGDIGLATSTNGINFTKQGKILTHNTTGWERQNIGTPSLYKNGSTWYVYYHGFGVSAAGGPDDCQVGVATGTSLTSLTKQPNPIIPTAALATVWDSGTVGHRDIVYENGAYYMVYEGSTDQPYPGARWSSGFARSTDLINWTKLPSQNVLGQTASYFGNDGPSFVKLGGKTWIYYRPDGGGPTARAEIATETSGGFDAEWNMSSPGIGHVIGKTDGDGWSATIGDPTSPGANYLSFGPYTSTLPYGHHIATWKLWIDNNTADNSDMVRLEVYDASTSTILSQRTITRKMWKQPNRYEYFSVPFKNTSPGNSIELRVFWLNHSYIKIQKIGIS